ncbi:transcription initiation factor TFIID subunit 2-like [Argopecten irradians]|uniref:transcription initiation factor TFIID subunit 2-like n=1 Tax=Argopecten irradians TaxID=31199 RepID=UPI0037101188
MQYGVFRDVRIAAVEAVVDYIKSGPIVKPEELTNLIEVIEKDPDVYFRHIVIRKLVQNPPFKRGEHSHLHTQALVERLWKLMNITLSHDSRLRCDIADLYFTLYGRTRPTCLGIPESLVVFNLKEKKAKFNPSVVPLEMEAMFEEDEEEVDDVETENVAMEVEDGEIVDMTEPSVSVETDIPHGTKRRADSPLDLGPHTSLDRNPTLESSIIEASTEGGQSEDSNTSFKLKIKIGGASLDTAPSSLPSVKEELHPPPTPSSAQVSTFNSEFFKFVGV